MKFPRSSGILLHISSLPGPYGIGDLGGSAHQFVDFVAKSGHSIWQILPLCPPANGNSPYSSYSALATNSNLISPDAMIEQGWGRQNDLDEAISKTGFENPDSNEVDFAKAREIRKIFFRKAFELVKSSLPDIQEFETFCADNAYWLEDFALYESIAKKLQQFDWTLWPAELAQRNPAALLDFKHNNQDEFEYSRFLQFVFEHQWMRLKSHCEKEGIRIYGDLPIFVDHQCSDVWANQSQFQLDEKGKPEFVAGVPPDYFSKTGQKWGNPLYRWDRMEQDDFTWWKLRFRRSLKQFDIIRVDHFRGFEAYYQIPADAPSAKIGDWIEGPGVKPFEAAANELGDLPIVAEDLGLITPEVDRLRDQLGFPTMRVMQFGYGSLEDNFHRPDHYPNHCFAYTGTHDNDTIMGWYLDQMENGPKETRQLLAAEFSADSNTAVQGAPTQPIYLQMVEAVLASSADTAVIPLQDYLGLGNEARMNLPATVNGNWKWKLREKDSFAELAVVIRELTRRHDRLIEI